MFKFKKIQRDQCEMIMKWRCSEHVTRYMHTDPKPKIEEQLRWFDKIDHSQYWMIYLNDKPIGLINLADYAPQHYRTSFGFYIGEKENWLSGAFILPYFYNFCFYSKGLLKITAEVFADNTNMIGIHYLCGFREVGTYYKHIYKNGKPHDIIALELHKADWFVNRKTDKSGHFEF